MRLPVFVSSTRDPVRLISRGSLMRAPALASPSVFVVVGIVSPLLDPRPSGFWALFVVGFFLDRCSTCSRLVVTLALLMLRQQGILSLFYGACSLNRITFDLFI
ncbi:hypothetical protein ZIOFF_056222 [Zingiber officinale]|uniref:Uncharacterized protein n=1 Tax=Zingiber officinale TaxID=94328 RepID=A0A8J5FGU9_ZINOF|nr:hypothetical protein ZIOFF_056222 [Zingiber officinale]